jgi:hypothetical protein
MPNSRRRLARDDETETDDPAVETLGTIIALVAVLEPGEADRLRELLAAWLVDETAEPEAAEPEAQDRRRRRLGHDAALPRGVASFAERYPFAERIRKLG